MPTFWAGCSPNENNITEIAESKDACGPQELRRFQAGGRTRGGPNQALVFVCLFCVVFLCSG